MPGELRFIIPSAAVGKERPRFLRAGAKAYTPARTGAWEKEIGWRARTAMRGRDMFHQGVAVSIDVFTVPPVSWNAQRKRDALEQIIMPRKRPDIDNIGKAVIDAMNRIVYDDDAQICLLVIKRVYAPEEFTEVTVFEMPCR